MAVQDSAANEQSPLLPPSPSSTTIADESVSTTPENEENSKTSALRGTALAACIGVLIFLQTANFSLMTTIQSSIAVDLDAFQDASWFTSTYLIAAASITPLAGRLCQIFSPRAYIFASCIIMAAGALVTSLSRRLALFLVGRALNGAGAAGVFPVSLILIIELTSVKRRGLYMGCVNTCYTIGVACGAIVAGALESLVGWRGIFALQVPLAIIMGIGMFLAIPSTSFSTRNTDTSSSSSKTERITSRLSHIDFLGVLLLVSTLVLFLYGLSTPDITYSTILASAVTLIAFLAVESNPKLFTTTEPILPLSILKHPPVLLTCLSTLGVMIARWSILFYTPVYALSVRDFPPAKAGLILLPTNAGFALGNLLLGHFHVRRSGSFYAFCLMAYALFTLSLLAISTATTENVGMWTYACAVGVNGFMIGASMIYTLTHVLHRTPRHSHFIVSSLIGTVRGLSACFGSAIGGGVFARILQRALAKGFQERGVAVEGERELIRRLLGSPALVRTLVGVEREVALEGYVLTLRTLFMAAAALAAVAMVLQAGTGWSDGQDDVKAGGVGDEEMDEEHEHVQIGAGQD